jgi:hypothetical protein
MGDAFAASLLLCRILHDERTWYLRVLPYAKGRCMNDEATVS